MATDSKPGKSPWPGVSDDGQHFRVNHPWQHECEAVIKAARVDIICPRCKSGTLGFTYTIKLRDGSNDFQHRCDKRDCKSVFWIGSAIYPRFVEAAGSTVDGLLDKVRNELMRATENFPPFNSGHEGYAVLLEEVDELWEDVRADRLEEAKTEAVQVAAMALRFITDLPPKASDAIDDTVKALAGDDSLDIGQDVVDAFAKPTAGGTP